MTLPVWLDDTFILSLLGLFGGGSAYLIRYFLVSRCRVIKCCCISCEREVVENPPIQGNV